MRYGSLCSDSLHHAVQTSPQHDNTVYLCRRHPLSSTLAFSLALFFMEGGSRTPVTGLIGKHLAPSNQSPSSTARTHIHTQTPAQGFRGNCGAGGRQNYLVYRASQTVVMRGTRPPPESERVGGGGPHLWSMVVRKTDRNR